MKDFTVLSDTLTSASSYIQFFYKNYEVSPELAHLVAKIDKAMQSVGHFACGGVCSILAAVTKKEGWQKAADAQFRERDAKDFEAGSEGFVGLGGLTLFACFLVHQYRKWSQNHPVAGKRIQATVASYAIFKTCSQVKPVYNFYSNFLNNGYNASSSVEPLEEFCFYKTKDFSSCWTAEANAKTLAAMTINRFSTLCRDKPTELKNFLQNNGASLTDEKALFLWKAIQNNVRIFHTSTLLTSIETERNSDVMNQVQRFPGISADYHREFLSPLTEEELRQMEQERAAFIEKTDKWNLLVAQRNRKMVELEKILFEKKPEIFNRCKRIQAPNVPNGLEERLLNGEGTSSETSVIGDESIQEMLKLCTLDEIVGYYSAEHVNEVLARTNQRRFIEKCYSNPLGMKKFLQSEQTILTEDESLILLKAIRDTINVIDKSKVETVENREKVELIRLLFKKSPTLNPADLAIFLEEFIQQSGLEVHLMPLVSAVLAYYPGLKGHLEKVLYAAAKSRHIGIVNKLEEFDPGIIKNHFSELLHNGRLTGSDYTVLWFIWNFRQYAPLENLKVEMVNDVIARSNGQLKEDCGQLLELLVKENKETVDPTFASLLKTLQNKKSLCKT